MKISTNKKRLIISSIILLITILLISFNYRTYIINNSFNYFLFSLSIIISIFACALFAIKVEMSNKMQLIISILSLITSIFFSYIIIELLNKNNLFDLYIRRLIFNFIVIIFLHLFIYAICNKIKLTIIIINSLIFIIGLANYVIVCFRGTPLVPWDILSIKTAAYVASSYTFSFSYHLLLAISLFIFIISLALKANYTFTKMKKSNLFLRFACILIISIITIAFYQTDFINYFDFENNLWKPKDEYDNNGFLASFIKQSKNLFNEKPENYSIKNLENIISEKDYTSTVEKSEDSPNIVVIIY